MKHRFAYLLLALAAALAITGCRTPAQPTTVPPQAPADPPLDVGELRTIEFQSESLGKSMKAELFLPKGYSKAGKYPVLYVLHGFGGKEGFWTSTLGLARISRQMLDAGKIGPMIIVSPGYDNSFGLNSADTLRTEGTLHYGRYEDFLTKDLIRYIDANYATTKDRTGRYIGGISMGGFTAMHLALRHPDLYSKVGGHSPGLWPDDGSADSFNLFLYPNAETRRQRDPFHLVQQAKPETLKSIRWYLDCGESDRFSRATALFKDALTQRGATVEYHSFAGAHDQNYWQEHLTDYLTFYAGK